SPTRMGILGERSKAYEYLDGPRGWLRRSAVLFLPFSLPVQRLRRFEPRAMELSSGYGCRSCAGTFHRILVRIDVGPGVSANCWFGPGVGPLTIRFLLLSRHRVLRTPSPRYIHVRVESSSVR